MGVLRSLIRKAKNKDDMSETRAEYGIVIDQLTIADSMIVCTRCGSTVGELITVGKSTWIKIGLISARIVRGICSDCGRPFNYDASDKQLSDLIARVKKNRQDTIGS